MIKELTCIGCPRGCQLSVTVNENGIFQSITGFSCSIGKRYGQEEVTHPTRMVTALMNVTNHKLPLSVKTNKSLEKEKIFDCLGEIQKKIVSPPVHIGDVIIANVCNTDVDIVATRNILS